MKNIDGRQIPLTWAEEMILKFLKDNKGLEISTKDLGDQTGIRYYLINEIVQNLSWKGHNVSTNKSRGVHCYNDNSWISFAILAGMFLFMIVMFSMAFLNYLDEEPVTPESYQTEI